MKKLIKVALIVGLVVAIAKVLEAKKAEWMGLSEAEFRAKLEEKMRDRVPEDQRGVMADKAVAKMREKGWLGGE